MLATSTGVLIKAIPEKPNVDFTLNITKNNNSNTKSQSSSYGTHTYPDSASHEHSGSESFEEGQTAEHTPDIEDTPPTTGPNGDFIPDHLWFVNAGHLDDVDAVYPDGSNSGGIPQAFLEIGDIGQVGNGYGFQGFGGQRHEGGTGTNAGKAYGEKDI